MGLSIRQFFIDEDEKIVRIPAARFERIRNRDFKESLPQYKNSRIRYAEIILELENRKPVSIIRIAYGYLQFDSQGKIDENFLDQERQVAINMMPSLAMPGEGDNVIYASNRFAKKKFKNEFTWKPSYDLEQEIITKAFE
ncbi:MAG: hypothetical protein KJ737_16355 [Proteobacteria bacterium]|nr:hypothetical protein [Pseudomonadota bacterium]